VRRFFRRGRLDAERAREMQAHLDHLVDDLIAAGYRRDQALREARRRFGNPSAIREEIYNMNSLPVLETLNRDLRYALRMLRKTPGFTLIALVTLAVGIGVNTAVFTLVNGLLLKPLPYPEPARLAAVVVDVHSPRASSVMDAVDGRTWFAIHDTATTVDTGISAGGGFGTGVNIVAGGVAANVLQERVSAGYFAVLGVKPFIGREFTADEDRVGGPPVAMLGHTLWRRSFNADQSVVGRSITLRGEAYTVVGVMPEKFTTATRADVWTPIAPNTNREGSGANYGMIARLRPGAAWSQGIAEVAQLGSEAAHHQGFKDDTTTTPTLMPLQEEFTSSIRQPLMMLWGAVGLVLLIACVNVAGLLIARSSLRTREIATRMALGSGRRAVIRQLLVESAVLAVMGGIAGAAVGSVVLSALKRLGDGVFEFVQPIELDATVLGITLVIALATSVIFGLVPALQASRVDVQGTLAESGTRSVAGGAGRWSRRILVVAQVAMGVVLLVSAGLLVRTFVHLRSLNPGFDPANVTTATVSLQDARYQQAVKVNGLFRDSLDSIRKIPGVEAAGISLQMPYQRLLNMHFKPITGGSSIAPGEGAIVNVSYVTPGFVEALRIPIYAGRAVSESDQADAPHVAVVNQAFVDRYYKGHNVIGKRIDRISGEREIVGVIANARAASAGWGNFGPIGAPPIIYVPTAQVSDDFLKLVHTWFAPSWVIRTSGPLAGLEAGLRQSVASVDPLLPIARIRPMSDVQAASIAEQRFMMSLVLGLGAVALLLAAIGIHGLIASSVGERTRELGIRLALGATGSQVMRDVLLPGITLAGIGVVIGSAGAFAAVRLLQSFLWGVTPTDPLTFGAVVATLLAVAFLASVIPALRVLRLDPALTLRAE
jgi:predicted permease